MDDNEPPALRSPLLGVVVVSFNSARHLHGCLPQWTRRSDVAVFVVDNASNDGSLDLARALGAEALAQPTNGGFARAANEGLRKALQARCAWVLVLNPDTNISADDVDLLLGMLHSGQPRLTLLIPERVGALRPYPRLLTLARLMLLPGYPERSVTQDPAERVLRRHYAVGFFLLLSSDAWRALGGFDEHYFLYSEDAELSRRMRELSGLMVRPIPVLPHHSGNHAVEDLPEPQVRAFVRSIQRFNGATYRANVFVAALITAGYALRAMASLLRWRCATARRQLSVAAVALSCFRTSDSHRSIQGATGPAVHLTYEPASRHGRGSHQAVSSSQQTESGR